VQAVLELPFAALVAVGIGGSLTPSPWLLILVADTASGDILEAAYR
jgi:hypothetical protein